MAETINSDYEVSSESSIVHWPISYARMTDATPTVTQPAEVTCLTAGLQLTGTVLVIDAVNSVAIVDFTCGMVYQHNVRNVLTYNPGVAELTWGAINEGDIVYYDSSATMPAGVKLSTSPLSTTAAQNAIFGRVVAANPVDMALFPVGGATASTQVLAVAQVGAGGS